MNVGQGRARQRWDNNIRQWKYTSYLYGYGARFGTDIRDSRFDPDSTRYFEYEYTLDSIRLARIKGRLDSTGFDPINI